MDNNQTHKRTHRFVAVELNNLIAMPPKRKRLATMLPLLAEDD